jgi:hypothetical protein
MRLNTEIVVDCWSREVLWKTKDSKPIILENYRPKPHDFKCDSYIYNRLTKFSEVGLDKIMTRMFKGNKFFSLYDTHEVIKQQSDVFQRAKEEDKRNKRLKQVEHIPSKQLKEEAHLNRLWHEQNRKQLVET